MSYKKKTIKQIDSYFIGDRVKINSINYDGNDILKIEFLIHAKNQSMEEIPSELRMLEFKVDQNKFIGIVN